MMRTLVAATTLFALVGAAAPALADQSCYQLSSDGKGWHKTAELLCVEKGSEAAHTITLKLGPPNEVQVARFDLALLNRARCIDCNEDVFGLANPENSVFNGLKIVFKGKRDVKKGEESGTVAIGKTQFRYRLVKAALAAPAAPPATPPPGN
jgi:hypothetical protein